MSDPDPQPPSMHDVPKPSGGPEGWLGVLGGLILAAIDTFTASAFGVTFQLNGNDVTLWMWIYFGFSFATLGYLIGHMVESRRRVRVASALLKDQMQMIQEAQVRLAQNEKLASLGQLAGAIAHEVRNPLAIIRSSVQNLGETIPPQDEAGKKSCAFVIDEIDRLTRVTASLLSFVKPLQVKARPIEVEGVLDRAELLAGMLLERKQIRLRRAGARPLPRLDADPDLLCQALLGLLVNAADATPAGGEVTLEARPVEGSVEIAVSDTGPGVAPELRARIFEPFFTTREEGHGLGLAVVKQIVESHGGRIQLLDPKEGRGACFAMRLLTAAPDRSAA